MPTNSNEDRSNDRVYPSYMLEMYTTCNNCGDIVSHVDTSTDFDRSDEPVWFFTGVACCGHKVNACQTITIGNPRSYDPDSEYPPFLQYVGRILSYYGYDVDDNIQSIDDLLKVWSIMPNSIQYEDLVMYYNTQKGDETNDE
jgi:hypothetical protein